MRFCSFLGKRGVKGSVWISKGIMGAVDAWYCRSGQWMQYNTDIPAEQITRVMTGR